MIDKASRAGRQTITRERLFEVLDYDGDTGSFRWKIAYGRGHSRTIPGTIAGGYDKNGYWRIACDGRTYFAHRLAWFYVYGRWPVLLIDHIDLDPDNNRISNLREATYSQNGCNAKRAVKSTSGLKGVYLHKKWKKWVAQITREGEFFYLGGHATREDAFAARIPATDRLHGEFARME